MQNFVRILYFTAIKPEIGRYDKNFGESEYQGPLQSNMYPRCTFVISNNVYSVNKVLWNLIP